MTKKLKWLWVLMSAFVLLSSGACNGNKSAGKDQAGRTSATLSVAFDAQASQAAKLKAARNTKTGGFRSNTIGTIDDIASITVDVQDGSGYIVQGVPLTNNGGTWSATIGELPLGEQLTFRGHAYNSASAEIFTGTTLQAVSSADDQIVITMVPASNGGTLQFLRITQIGRPANIAMTDTVPVSISILGNTGETLSYTITPAQDGGSFSPASGSITLAGTSATIVVSYTAPAVAGVYTHTIAVTNDQGNSVSSAFTTTVISGSTDPIVSVQFNPVVTAVTAGRNGSDVAFAAYVSDAGPSEALTYFWAFNGGLSFADPRSNPAVLQGYDETVQGIVTLTVANGTGGSTTVSYTVGPGQFPVSVVTNLPFLPQIPTRIARACEVAAASGNIIALKLDAQSPNTLGYYDITQQNLVDTGIAILEGVAIEGDVMVFRFADTGTIGWYSISQQASHDTGITPDGYSFGRSYQAPSRLISNGRIVYVSGGLLNLYDVNLQTSTPLGVAVNQQGDPGNNNYFYPTFSGDIIAFVGPSGTIQYYNVATGQTTDTGAVGAYPTIDNGIIAYQTPSGQIAYYDIAKGSAGITPFKVRDDGHFSISGGIVAVTVAEGGEWGDLNGDGVIDGGGYLLLYDISTGKMVNTGIKVCCGPDINGMVITYDDDIDCSTWYFILDTVARQYFGR